MTKKVSTKQKTIKKAKQHTGPKILFLDIETLHSLMACFGIYDQTIPHGNILAEWKVATVSWKWAHEKKFHSLVSDIKKGSNIIADINDSILLKTFYDVLCEADIVVGHNISAFDMKKLKARFIQLGFPPLPLPKNAEVDTLLHARREFGFTSNRLDYIAKYLGLKGKMSTPANLWLDVLAGDKKALQIMAKYNVQDVAVLEQVYYKMVPWMRNHPNFNLWTSDKCCTNCGSTHLNAKGQRIFSNGLNDRYQCQNCGKWLREIVKDSTKKINKKLRSV